MAKDFWSKACQTRGPLREQGQVASDKGAADLSPGAEKPGCALTAGISSDPGRQQSSAPAGPSVSSSRRRCRGWLSCSRRRLQRTPDSVSDSIPVPQLRPRTVPTGCKQAASPGLDADRRPLAARQRVCVTLAGPLGAPGAPFPVQSLTGGRVRSARFSGGLAGPQGPGSASSHSAPSVAGLQAAGDPEGT